MRGKVEWKEGLYRVIINDESLFVHKQCFTKTTSLKAIERMMLMLRAFVSPVIGVFYDLLIPQENKSFSKIFRSFLHAIVFACVVVVVTQQISSLGDLYAHKGEEYQRAYTLYTAECPYNGASAARLKECSDLNIILNSWPAMRAVSQLVKGWNSCLYMPCDELITHIANGLPYKIAFALITLGLASYCLNFFNCAKKKSKEYLDKHRLKETNKAVASMHELIQKQATQQFGYSP